MFVLGLGDPILIAPPSEHLEQVRFVSWFRKTWPNVLIFAIPNGGGRSMAQGASLKAEGVVAGIPDLFIPAWLTWVEMKKVFGGIVSPAQKGMIHYLQSLGHHVIIGHGFENAKAQIEAMKKP
jgi:hypothetical protein